MRPFDKLRAGKRRPYGPGEAAVLKEVAGYWGRVFSAAVKIVLAPVGTRGDVQPLLALGLALKARGHGVTLCTAGEFGGWIRSRGLEWVRVGSDFSELLGGIQEALDLGTRLAGRLSREVEGHFATLAEACREADVLVGATLQMAGPSVAEQRGIPYVFVVFSPNLIPTEELPGMAFPWKTPPGLRPVFPRLQRAARNFYFRGRINAARNRRGMAPIGDVVDHFTGTGLRLMAFDPHLGQVPRLGGRLCVTGPWYFESGEELEPELEAFLAAGAPPIYLGFGSMKALRPEAMTQLLVRAAEGAGVRAVVRAGGARPEGVTLPANVRLMGNGPHEKLFPRLAGVVHHGGAGTTAAAARAGIPQVVVPHLGDQFYWGWRVEELGIGPKPVGRLTLSAGKLARAIRDLGKPEVQTRARELAGQMAGDGLARAVAAVEAAG